MNRVDYERYDLRLVRVPSMVFVILIVLGLAMIYFGWVFYEDSKAAVVEVKRELINVTSEKRKADNLVGTIDSYENQYSELVEEKYFSDDLKLRWLESFGAIADKLGILGVDYNIGALAVDAEANQTFDGELEVSSMPVSLRMELLHEVDLLEFEEQLQNSGLGLYVVEGCEIVRETETVDLRVVQSNLHSYCNYKAYQISLVEGGQS